MEFATLDLEKIRYFDTICYYKWKNGEKFDEEHLIKETCNQVFESLDLLIDSVK